MSRRLEGMVRTARGLPAALALFGGGMGLVAGAAPVASAALVVLVLGAGLLALAQVWLGKVVVDELALVAGARGAQGEAASASDLWPAALAASLYAVTMVVQQCYWPLQQALSGRIQERAAAEIDRRLMAAGGRLVDLGRVERPAFQDEVRVAQETNLLVSRLLQFVHQGAGNLLTLAGVLLLLARLHPLLPVALVLLGLPPLGVTQRMMQLALQSMAQRSRAAREAEYYTRLTVEPGAAKELRAFGLGDFFLRRFEARHEAALCEVSGLRYRELRAFLLLGGAQAVALAAGFWYVATQVGAGRLTLGDLALYLGAGARATDLLFAESFHNLSLALAQCKACFAILGAEPVITLPPRGRGLSAPPVLRHGIELRGVRFRYPEHDRDVLRDVSATLPAGQVTALVGANGAGKSTLVKLLTRMYDPTAGQLLLDGQPLPAYDLHSLRARIAVVYQDFARFSFTFGENVAVGAVGIAGTLEAAGGAAGAAGDADWPGAELRRRVARAVQAAGAGEVLARLPRGYDTPLTRRFEGGVELSGGEWQTVALARGFVRDAALIILDEPSSALDAAAEARLFQQFRALAAGKTALLISHRLSTVRLADHILVLEGGRVVEAGSHAALLGGGGRYATLYRMQASRYR